MVSVRKSKLVGWIEIQKRGQYGNPKVKQGLDHLLLNLVLNQSISTLEIMNTYHPYLIEKKQRVLANFLRLFYAIHSSGFKAEIMTDSTVLNRRLVFDSSQSGGG